mgnify:CR=1 FL=1
MLGTFQQSSLRIEVEASADQIEESLIYPSQFRRWLWPQRFSEGMPEPLMAGMVFKSFIGPLEIRHEVQSVTDTSVHLLLAGAIDGFHQWHWGEGWVQSRLEGVSMLPLNLAQSLNIWRLRQHLNQLQQTQQLAN